MKLLDSNEIRQLRDVFIFEVNDMEVYMQSSEFDKNCQIPKETVFLLIE